MLCLRIYLELYCVYKLQKHWMKSYCSGYQEMKNALHLPKTAHLQKAIQIWTLVLQKLGQGIYAQVLVCSTCTHCIICIYKASLFEDDVVSWFCRLNFSTAFSTNAVSMFHSVGLMKVTRVEKSMRYMLKLKRRNDVSGYCEISEVIIVCFFD